MDSPPEASEAVACAKNLVGKVIGRGGDTIKDLQARSGCRFNINQDVSPPCITVSGSAMAVPMAVKMLKRVMEADPKGGNAGVYAKTEVVECDPGVVGRVIGRKGETIRALQARSGARIQICQDQSALAGEKRKMTVQGTNEQVQLGLRLLNDVMTSDTDAQSAMERSLKRGLGEMLGDTLDPNSRSQAARVTMKIPESCVGSVIGKGGRQIKEIQKSNRTTIHISEAVSMSNEREIIIDANSVKDAAATVRMLKAKVAAVLAHECEAPAPDEKRVHYDSNLISANGESGGGGSQSWEQQVKAKKQAAASILKDVSESAQLSIVEGPTAPPMRNKAQALAQEGASINQVHLSNSAVRRIIGKGEFLPLTYAFQRMYRDSEILRC
jgi:far upstream element-binding protein